MSGDVVEAFIRQCLRTGRSRISPCAVRAADFLAADRCSASHWRRLGVVEQLVEVFLGTRIGSTPFLKQLL